MSKRGFTTDFLNPNTGEQWSSNVIYLDVDDCIRALESYGYTVNGYIWECPDGKGGNDFTATIRVVNVA